MCPWFDPWRHHIEKPHISNRPGIAVFFVLGYDHVSRPSSNGNIMTVIDTLRKNLSITGMDAIYDLSIPVPTLFLSTQETKKEGICP